MAENRVRTQKMDWTDRMALLLLARRLQSDPEIGDTGLRSTLLSLPELQALTEDRRSAIADRWPEESLRRVFRHHGVANPALFTDVFGRSLIYYVVDARGQYLAVEAFASTQSPIVNIHRIFGQHDLLLLGVGQRADRQMSDFESTMARLRTGMLVLEVERAARYKGHMVPPLPEGLRELDESWTRTLDAFTADYDEAKIQPIRGLTKLTQKSYLLGSYWSEDFYVTSRVQAFVAVQFLDVVRKDVEDRYGDLLLEIETVRPHLVSVYRLRGGQPYHYLVELVCDTYAELDVATDDIIALAPVPVETLTFPIAGTGKGGLPQLSAKALGFGRGMETIWAALSPDERSTLRDMPADDLTLIALRDTLDSIIPDRREGALRARDEDEREIYEVAKRFTKAVLTKSVNNVLSVRGQLFAELERRIRDTAEAIVDREYDGDARRALMDVGASVRLPLDWSSAQTLLGKWVEREMTDSETLRTWQEADELATALRAVRNQEFHGLGKARSTGRDKLGFTVLSAGKDLSETAYCLRLVVAIAVRLTRAGRA